MIINNRKCLANICYSLFQNNCLVFIGIEESFLALVTYMRDFVFCKLDQYFVLAVLELLLIKQLNELLIVWR